MTRLINRRVLHSGMALLLALAGAGASMVGCADGVAIGIDAGRAMARSTDGSDRNAHAATEKVGSEEGTTESVSGSTSTTAPEPAKIMSESVEVAGVTPPAIDDQADADTSSTLVAHVVVEQISAYSTPTSKTVVATFDNPNRHGGPMVFQSLIGPDSRFLELGWIPVLLPVRPNGTVGWIETSQVKLTRNPYRIEVDVDDFTLTVYRHDEEHYSTAVGIGDGDTPTPYGAFYLTDLLRPSDPNGIYGPYAYGLSGFSETLDSFNGGPGVIGIHGTNQPSAIGSRVSHGCIRVANEAISEMAEFLPLGTPVVIDNDPSASGE